MNREIDLDGAIVNDNSDCYFIAEIGHNHQGNLETAKKLFKAAKEAGANAVKLQKRHNKSLYTSAMFNEPYNSENAFAPTYGEHREYLELDREQYQELKKYAKELDITLFSTPFDFLSADFLNELDMPLYKIASADLKNIPLIKYVAEFGKPVLISTGGCTLDDITRAYDVIAPINDKICFLQCTASYPCDSENLNLSVIKTLRDKFPELVIGLSSHDNGIAMPLVAYMLGARVIEKHFTLNRTMKGTDQVFSLTPEGMRKMIRDVKRARGAIGDGIKKVLEIEEAPIYKMGKMLVAARELHGGHILTENDIALKSPAGGIHPYEIDNILGKKLISAMDKDDPIRFDNIE